MRIVLDLQACQTSGSRNRGIGRYSMALCQAMARQARGHEIVIALTDRFPDTIDPIRKALDGLVHKKNIHVFNTIGPLAELDPANMWRARAAERIRENFIAGLSPDVVHVSSLFEGAIDDAVTSTGSSEDRFDTAVTLYDLIPLIYKETYLSNPRMRDWYYRKLLALKNAELLLSISEHSRDEAIAALQVPSDHIVNISSAVDSVFRPRILSIEEAASLRSRYGFSKPFLMYTGGIDHRKNIERLIEAFAKLPGDIKAQYQLVIVCSISDDNRRRLGSLASEFGLGTTDIVFTGYVPEEDLVALYNACALFVFPSLHEGFGLPVLEAMCCGAAVIGSNTSSIPEVLGREDALFDPRDAAAIANKIHAALTDEDFKASLQRHGPRQAKQFSWDASAQRALDAFEHLHERRLQADRVAVAVKEPRPRMAYLSPLPPEKSGIADYSAELLPELARHYDIEVVVTQAAVTDSWITANFPVRSVEWFAAHAADYDRILYHFGNSSFHLHMFELLLRYPGVVVLHDFFMSGALEYADNSGYMPGSYTRALYESHGYAALITLRKNGREEAMWKYPCNKWILDRALGVIVHSKFSMQLADKWYGEGSAASWRLVKQLRAAPAKVDRQAARMKLGLSDDDFLVCSFGMLGPTKLNDRLLDAWTDSLLARETQCHLAFVGENHAGLYGYELLQKIAASGSGDCIKITGFASQDLYQTYLAAADAAVQLRTKSRGETSRTVLDCIAYGIPTIINMHGSLADLPDDVVVKIADDFPVSELGSALAKLRENCHSRQILSQRALDYVRSEHHPVHIAAMFRDAIEEISTASTGARYEHLIRSLAAIAAPVSPSEQDLIAAARSIASNQPASILHQVVVDISGLVHPKAISDHHGMIRDVLDILLNEPVEGYRVEPVYETDKGYLYARRFMLDLIGMPDVGLEDTPVDIKPGDVFLGLRADAHEKDLHHDLFMHYRNQGVQVFPVVLDLLRPQAFLNRVHAGLVDWLNSVSGIAEPACFSSSIEDEFSSSTDVSAVMRRRLARKYIGMKDTDIVICSFCSRTSEQSDERLLDAWLQSPLADDERCHLVFVGEHGKALAKAMVISDRSQRVLLTEGVPDKTYRAYMRAADVVVQLQPIDNSASTVLRDCLANGVPAIINAGNPALKLFGKALLQLKDGPTQTESDEHIQADTEAGPSRVVEIYRDYLEYVSAQRLSMNRHTNTERHIPHTAQQATTSPARQMLVDVTFLAQHNLNSGIQRVVHHVLVELLRAPPAGYRVEPVYDAGGYYAYARRFTSRIAGRMEQEPNDEPIRIRADDVFLGLDLCPDSVRRNQPVFDDFRKHGVKVYFVVYDLLPILRPAVFPKDAQANFVDWLETITFIADGLVGISRTVADDMADWIDKKQLVRATSLRLGYFHLGAELGETPKAQREVQFAHARPSILMVGTVEPRKGHAQALSVFEKLWAQGLDADLVIVGRQGWMVESLVARLRTHPENGKHLFWFEGASDETLLKLYQSSSALLLASEGEGFGLPLIEAARHKLPIIARDLPVFREVAGDHAFYFSGTNTDNLIEALQRWFSLYAENHAPSSEQIPWLTWAESAQQLMNAVIGENWYRMAPKSSMPIASSTSVVPVI